jgi:DNA repair protein RadC
MVHVWQRLNMEEPALINNTRKAAQLCKSICSGLRNEEFWVICLNAQCKVVGKRRISQGSLSEVSAYPRAVIETALNYNAHSVLLTHNHPGGTCVASPDDIASTDQLKKLLNGLGILVLDHIIVANDSTYSMVEHGDLGYR